MHRHGERIGITARQTADRFEARSITVPALIAVIGDDPARRLLVSELRQWSEANVVAVDPAATTAAVADALIETHGPIDMVVYLDGGGLAADGAGFSAVVDSFGHRMRRSGSGELVVVRSDGWSPRRVAALDAELRAIRPAWSGAGVEVTLIDAPMAFERQRTLAHRLGLVASPGDVARAIVTPDRQDRRALGMIGRAAETLAVATHRGGAQAPRCLLATRHTC